MEAPGGPRQSPQAGVHWLGRVPPCHSPQSPGAREVHDLDAVWILISPSFSSSESILQELTSPAHPLPSHKVGKWCSVLPIPRVSAKLGHHGDGWAGISQRGDRPGPNEPSHSPPPLPLRALTFLLHTDRIRGCHFPLPSPQILPISRCPSPAPGLPQIQVYSQLTCHHSVPGPRCYVAFSWLRVWPSCAVSASLGPQRCIPATVDYGRLGLECVLGLPLVWTQPSTLQLPPSSFLPFSASEISAHLCAVFLCPCLYICPLSLEPRDVFTQDLPNSLMDCSEHFDNHV